DGRSLTMQRFRNSQPLHPNERTGTPSKVVHWPTGCGSGSRPRGARDPDAVSLLKREKEMSRHHVTVTVNGEQRRAEVEARKLLGPLFPEEFGVTSAHVRCGTTQCGACDRR